MVASVRTTIFSTPILTPILRVISIIILKFIGWNAKGEETTIKKFVLIGAPHTSNWDFPLMLMVVLKLKLSVFWMGKHTLFPFPFAGLMKWLGGIPINRLASHNVVREMVKHYKENNELIVLIPPEGTRSKVSEWKTGFYHIANMANVPILLGYVDAKNKEAGFVDFFYPTGNTEKDMDEIQKFYAPLKGLIAKNS
jgi:1-acyl-sn-glycerol-3-phosphate acyltransferase